MNKIDQALIDVAKASGGKFHGPIVEHLSISEKDYVDTLAPALVAFGYTSALEEAIKTAEQYKCKPDAGKEHIITALVVLKETLEASISKGLS